jgi:lysophospholipase L1-like esterase
MKILFQGDSITDAGRSRELDFVRGNGYPTIVAAKLGYEYPNQYEFINRGISGNRVTDLLARIQCHMINLEPDVMSILIGVNDVWHEINYRNGVRTELFENVYNILIQELKAEKPDLRIMLMEPFVLKGSATEANWDAFKNGVAEKAAAVKRVAENNNLEFIPLQDKLDEACEKAPASYWLYDGVHPTAAGHELIAREWIKQFGENR